MHDKLLSPFVVIPIGCNRADQNMGGALLEFPARTAMNGKSRVSSPKKVRFC